MSSADYRLERLTAALLSRQATLKRSLELRDQTQRFDQSRGFVYLLRGPERQRVADELQSVEALLAAATPAD